jgi:hypothetical protein
MVKTQVTQGGSSGIQSVIVVAITLFALSGLMVGFAYGAFTHPRQPKQANNNPPPQQTQVVKQTTTTPTVTATAPVQAHAIGCPAWLLPPTYSEQPDGISSYKVTIQADDNSSSGCGTSNTALRVAGITSKIWVTKTIPNGKLLDISANQTLLTSDQISTTLTGKIGNETYSELPYLSFSSSTPQVQTTDAQGQASWNYTVNPGSTAGGYSLVILTDWNGYYNLSWYGFGIS